MTSCHGSKPTFTKSNIILIKNGQIQGKCFSFNGGKEVESFLGVPYGKPPVGELRFKKPEPAEAWDGVKDCTKFGPSCPYDDLPIDKFFLSSDELKVTKSEDCLYLNVFAPKWKSGKDHQSGFAVLVWIHGGGFNVHSAANYGDYGICKGICTKDVIVVTINYRLGIFGFFCTGDENAKGNFGMWDQVLALKWVKENIQAFGGDPNNITVFGHSSGGVSVDLLALSPHSKDLFQKMYCLAGTGYFHRDINTPEHIRKACLEFAIQCGYKPSDGDDQTKQNLKLLEFFKTLSPEKLTIGMLRKEGFKINSYGIDLSPNIDKDFLPKPLDELRKEMPKKICMNGVTEKEGIFRLFFYQPKGDLKEAIEQVLIYALKEKKVKNIEEAKKKLQNVYYKSVDTNDEKQLLNVYISIVGDAKFSYPNWKFCDEMVKNGHTVYQYNFEYINPNSYSQLKDFVPMIAATHGTELSYIFNKGIFSEFFPSEIDEIRMAEMMTTYVANFAKYGNPNGLENVDSDYWEPLTSENTTRFLKINLPKSVMKENLYQGRMKAWHQILQEDKLYN